ncbi:MAG: calcium/sodium antiporter [Pseudomonadales bacterium]|nr:calcium/sodium antiporter [Pseudomonadales bacterium]MDG0999895.1 calcium/sodium antiporter [Pseudomonadales bacterium]MDG1305506.1 calcium/sodium antiporter [Pseudomonadales bacterium]MDG1909863.1 calcium/sodium antiporter [Pseudomonadales bacterium]
MLLLSFALLVGFLILFKSADYFVIGAVTTARNFHISPTIVGLTIVALGTSAPEIFVAVTSSLQGEPELAVGNAIGSNIANIGMVLGITALIIPLPFRDDILKKDLPIMFLVTLCAGATLVDFHLGFWDGLLLFACLATFLYRLAHEHLANRTAESEAENDKPHAQPESAANYEQEYISELDEITDMSQQKAVLTLILSLVFLLLSSELLVWSVVKIAHLMGVSELIIGLTVVAIGTSLPELVVSVTSAVKGETDLAIGNIVGSNIFNMLAVLAIPCLLAPTEIASNVFWRDFGLMFGLTVLLGFFAYGFSGRSKISRPEGGILLLAWLGYVGSLYFGF